MNLNCFVADSFCLDLSVNIENTMKRQEEKQNWTISFNVDFCRRTNFYVSYDVVADPCTVRLAGENRTLAKSSGSKTVVRKD